MNDFSIQYKSYSDDQSNVPGALLFLGYIVAALVFSIRIWTIIWHRYTSRTASKSLNVKAKRSITLSAVIALLSFSVLSYNMLSFLVLSYQDWTRRKGINESFMFHPALLWQWISHATLFEDFARSLVATPARSLWTQLALLQTYHIVTKVYRGVCQSLPVGSASQ